MPKTIVFQRFSDKVHWMKSSKPKCVDSPTSSSLPKKRQFNFTKQSQERRNHEWKSWRIPRRLAADIQQTAANEPKHANKTHHQHPPAINSHNQPLLMALFHHAVWIILGRPAGLPTEAVARELAGLALDTSGRLTQIVVFNHSKNGCRSFIGDFFVLEKNC